MYITTFPAFYLCGTFPCNSQCFLNRVMPAAANRRGRCLTGGGAQRLSREAGQCACASHNGGFARRRYGLRRQRNCEAIPLRCAPRRCAVSPPI